MDHTLKYHLAHYKMTENFRAVLGVDTLFFFVSVMVDFNGYFLSSGSRWKWTQLLYKEQPISGKSELFVGALWGGLPVLGLLSCSAKCCSTLSGVGCPELSMELWWPWLKEGSCYSICLPRCSR